jgi:hypothetical protein
VIPATIFNDDILKITGAQPYWSKSVLTCEPVGGDSYYVLNMSLLYPSPQVQPSGEEPDPPLPTPMPPAAQAGANDMIVLPYDENNKPSPRLISRDLYMKCPQLPEEDIPDIVFMAVEEGVVVANLPKLELTGITCRLLNLTSLRPVPSADAVAPARAPTLDKTSYVREVGADQLARLSRI